MTLMSSPVSLRQWLASRLAGAGLLGLALMPLGLPEAAFAQVEPVDRVIAVVNNEVVTERELARQVRVVQDRLRQRQASVPPPDVLEKRVLEQIILDRAQAQAARERGITINESQVDRGIDQIARDNRLSLAQLREQLQREGISFATFRDDIRQQIIRARLREATVGSNVRVSDADIDAWLAEQAGKQQQATELQVSQLLLQLPEDPSESEVSAKRRLADEITAQLKDGASFAVLVARYSDAPNAASNGGSLGWRTLDQLPRLFADAVSGMAVGDISPVVQSPAGLHILKLVDKRGGASALDQPIPQTKVRHILIRPSDALSEDEIRRQMQSIRERLIAGQVDFAAMARQYSVDGSAANGGELGWVYAGDTVPEFERAMDALAPNQISEPIRTQFGFHLIEVLDRRSDSASPERRRQIARRALIEEKTEAAWREWLDELRARTYVEYRFER